MRVIYNLEGLACAHCAAKIEAASRELENVASAVVDFSTSRIVLELKEADNGRLKTALQETVAALEPDVIVTEQKMQREKPRLFTAANTTFFLGIASFSLALLLPQGIDRILFLTAYALAGYEVLSKAVRNISRGQIFDENFLMTIATLGALAIGEYPEAASVMIFYRTAVPSQHLWQSDQKLPIGKWKAPA